MTSLKKKKRMKFRKILRLKEVGYMCPICTMLIAKLYCPGICCYFLCIYKYFLQCIHFVFVHFYWISLLDRAAWESGSCPSGFDGRCSQDTVLFVSFKFMAQRKRPSVPGIESDFLQIYALKMEIKRVQGLRDLRDQ